MYPVTALSTSCWLVPYAPNTGDAVGLKARVVMEETRSQTGRGTRRPQHYLLRHDLSWFAQMKVEEFCRARAASIVAQDESILVPLWPAARLAGAAAVLTSALTVAWTRGWASYAINPVSLAGYDYFAPLMMGSFKQPPRLTGRQSDLVRAEFFFTEIGPAAAALTPPDEEDITFPTPDGFYAPVFLWSPEGGTPPDLSLGQVEVERTALGPGRQPSSVYYPQARETTMQPTLKLRSAAEAVELLGWWLRRGGGADALWIATTQAIGALTADLAAGSGTITTVAAMSIAAGDTLALLTTGLEPEFVRIATVAGNVATLSGATAVAHPKAWTTIVPALLAHHADAELALDFRRANEDWIADATLAFREVAAEYAAGAGETRGTTLGRLPATAWLFVVELDYKGAIDAWHLTSWESGGTTSDAQVWQYADCDFDRLLQSLDLEDDTCSLRIRWWPGCPWENWLPGQLAATGRITILRAPVSSVGALGAPTAVWSGELSTPEREGPMLTVKVLGANTLFARKAPHQAMTQTCYKRHYGPRCGLALADWKFNATVVAVADHTLTLGTITRANGGDLPGDFAPADWFALGWAQWTDDAGHPLRAEVLASAALAGGEIVLTLARPLGCDVGDAVQAVPGCDKQKASCYVKFSNFNAFGGFHAMPAVSPNFVIPQTKNTPAKK